MIVVLVLVLALLGPAIHDVIRRPGLRRLAVRNILRRPGEAALVVVGSMIGTAIITAAFIVGDTFENSIVDIARTNYGPVDEEVIVDGLDRRGELATTLEGFAHPDVDGQLTMLTAGATVADVPVDGADRRAEPFARIAETDFDAARAFGGDVASTGMADAGPTPGPGELVVSERLADEIGVSVGDPVQVFSYGLEADLTVRTVVPEIGLGGYADAYLAPGSIDWFVASSQVVGAAPPSYAHLYSNVGGVFDGVDRSDDVVAALEAQLAGLDGVEVEDAKQSLLDEARREGESVGQIFFLVGSFSVVVGILLLVNLFVMLAEERKQELGMLRAVGLRRNHLLRAFGIEGAIYSVTAAVAGGFVGIGVGWAIGLVVNNIIGGSEGLPIVFEAEPGSVVAGMVIGLVIALITAWLTSGRIARLNVIRAIRDLPEPVADRPSLGAIVRSSLGLFAGLALLVVGVGTDADTLLVAGPAIALLSSITLLRGVLPRRLAVVVPAVATLVWGQAVFAVFPDQMQNVGVEVFLVQGLVLVAAAVLLLSSADLVWNWLTERFVGEGRGLSARLALAYPLARKARTGILLAMFALVIFVMTFMSVFTEIFGRQADTFAAKDRGGFDVYVDSNFANPVSADELGRVDGVTDVASLVRGFPEFTAPFQPEETFWSTAGFDRSLLDGGVPQLSSRAPDLPTDDAVFEAILASAGDPVAKAIVPDYFLADGGGPPASRPQIGQTVLMYSPTSDAVQAFEIVGVTEADFVFNGLLTARSTLEDFLGTNVYAGRHYVQVAAGRDAAEVAARLDGAFIRNGVQAETFLAAVQEQLAEQQGFFRLMQGYLGLGLLIGVAGLGVVMVRAVRERRRQVGILRAMGFPAATVRRAFLLEAAFVALQGILVGIALGLLTCWQVLVSSDTFGEATLPFVVPWSGLAVILAVPLVASLLATVTPAAQASAIRPAVALRIAD